MTANNLPATCLPNDSSNSNISQVGRLGIGAQTLVGTSIKAFSRLAYKEESKTLTGTSVKIRNWKLGD